MIKKYKKDGKIFYTVRVVVRNKTGKQLQKYKSGITSEKKAKDIEYNFKRELDAISERSTNWTFKKWYCECVQRMKYQYKKSTIFQYEGWFKNWVPKEMSQMLLNEFTKDYIQKFIFDSSKINCSSNATKKNIMKRLNRIFQLAEDEGIILKNPCRGIVVRSERSELNVLNVEEVESLLKNAKEVKHDFYPIWMMAVFTGLRSGEMYALRWQDIDFNDRLISVNKQWTSKDGIAHTKTKKSRIVPISNDLLTFLKEEKLKGTKYEETVFDSRANCKVFWDDFVLPRLWRWNKGTQAAVLRNFCEIIGITSIRFHDLRATFITNMLAQGVALVKVMSIVGHCKMATTDGYLRLSGVGTKGTTDKLGYSAPKDKASSMISLSSHRKNAVEPLSKL